MKIFLNDVETVVNYETGEIVEKTVKKQVLKRKPRFQFMNVETNWHRDLSPIEFQLIVEMSLYENQQTFDIVMDNRVRSKIAENLKVSDITVKKCLSNLLKTPYLKKVTKGVYMINPDCLWSGSDNLKLKKEELFQTLN